MPQIDIATGIVTNGPIIVNTQFQWVNRSATITCHVSATPAWFNPNPCSVNPNSSATATATAIGTWSYASGCLEQGSNPRIPVSGHPGPAKK